MELAEKLLVASLAVPAIGAGLILLLAGQRRQWAARLALATTLLTLLLVGGVVFGYAPAEAVEYAVVDQAWLGGQTGLDIRISIGLDGVGLWFYGLSALLMVTGVLVSWEAIEERAGTFYAMLLLLETGMLGVFVARDIILFYVFFEFTLIPLFFLIGIWGSEQRRYAAMKFFLFTLAGSVLTFLGLLSIVVWHYWQPGTAGLTFSIPELTAALGVRPLPLGWQYGIFAALFIGFAIKVPLFPLHTWLPLAHVQAPTAGSVLLAGVLLKIGTYGFARFNLPLLPDATAALAPWLLWVSVAGIVYGALVALAQADIKRLIAYSSVSHLGFCMLGLFALNRLGTQGGVLQAVNHGLSTGALFAIVGMIYERYHTRRIADLSGLAAEVPVLAFCMVFFTFSSIGLPGMNGFAGEFLVLLGMFQRGWQTATNGGGWQLMTIAVLAVSGVVLGAWYMLWLVQRVFFGPLRQPPKTAGDAAGVRDLTWRELFALAPLAVFVLWIGIQPKFFLDRMAPSLDGVVAAAERSWERNSQQVEVSNRDDRRR